MPKPKRPLGPDRAIRHIPVLLVERQPNETPQDFYRRVSDVAGQQLNGTVRIRKRVPRPN